MAWYVRWLIRWRLAIVLVGLSVAVLAATGMRHLYIESDYRYLFSEDNPQLRAFEALQEIYTKNDNILVAVAPRTGEVFSAPVLSALEQLTAEAWRIPYAIRVDSVTNFQHVWAKGDTLIVEQLVSHAESYSPSDVARIRRIALSEPKLINRLVSSSGHVAGINVTLHVPGKDISEMADAVRYARELVTTFRAEHPDLDFYLTGIAPMTQGFNDAVLADLRLLVPIMYGGMVLTMLLLLRSVSATIITVTLILISAASAMGIAGFLGMPLSPPSSQAPTMIMTLAVADSIHLLTTMLQSLGRGEGKTDALVESLRVNLQPVVVTSVTTAIGFLSFNFSDVPAMHDLGNITAMGVMIALGYALVFVPALVAIFPMRCRVGLLKRRPLMDFLAQFAIERRRHLFWATGLAALGLAALVPRNELNDEFVRLCDERVPFRRETDFVMENLTGLYQIEYSLDAGEPGGINSPEYLQHLEAFAAWYRSHPSVIHVDTLSETMKRLNRSLHGDDAQWYRLPESRELAAQYLLLYEMSLPYGLDLNNQINIDKSATRFIVTFRDGSSIEMRRFDKLAAEWLRENTPRAMHTSGSGTSVMFSYMTHRNIRQMIKGTSVALILISFCLVFALRSLRFGAISLIPNLIPGAMAFGVWGILVGRVGAGLSVVVAMTLGIIVDDTVHFLSKYLRARREHRASPEEAVRYAFSTVGFALVSTSLILVVGFGILSQSAFQMNAQMGQLTAITILLALALDFLFLPAVLMQIDGKRS